VDVLFESDRLKTDLSTHRVLQKQWARSGAKRISLRLQQLAAVTTLAGMRELPGAVTNSPPTVTVNCRAAHQDSG